MSSFGLYGCVHMHQPTDIYSYELVYMYNPPTPTHSEAGDGLGELEVWAYVLCMGVNGVVFFLPLHVAFGTQTQVARLVWQSSFAYVATL